MPRLRVFDTVRIQLHYKQTVVALAQFKCGKASLNNRNTWSHYNSLALSGVLMKTSSEEAGKGNPRLIAFKKSSGL